MKMHRIETITLPSMSVGTSRSLKVHRDGAAGARPKAYIVGAEGLAYRKGRLMSQ